MPPRMPAAETHDLNGVWHCNDGGQYFVRQIGDDVMWYGEASPTQPFFANVAHGTLDEYGTVRLMWADVPKGKTGACGALVLKIDGDGGMAATRISGGFGGSTWRR